MIYITLGTQNNDFTRCLKEFEKVVAKYNITEDVIVQKGYTKYTPAGFKCSDFVSETDYQKFIGEASIVISHAGSGALFSSIAKHKKIIAVARLAQYGEMVNDHQIELVKKLSELGYLVDGTYDMASAWEKVQDFVPNNQRIECGIMPEIDRILQVWGVERRH
jgi:UDP-N-acetylglucosamine transferase subunit ALG13